MKYHFEYLLEKMGWPYWWEETGHPRYEKFKPNRTYNIYAREVVLLEIQCQACATVFKVSMNWGKTFDGKKLSDQIKDGFIHYGDPPNVRCCLAGASMNCEDIKVLEFWEQSETFEWERIPELEITLPDGKEESNQ